MPLYRWRVKLVRRLFIFAKNLKVNIFHRTFKKLRLINKNFPAQPKWNSCYKERPKGNWWDISTMWLNIVKSRKIGLSVILPTMHSTHAPIKSSRLWQGNHSPFCSFTGHKPISVPHHWKESVKSQVDADVALNIIEPVRAGTPTIWCSRMITVP